MPVEAPPQFTGLTSFKKYDILQNPGPGGRHEPYLDIDNTIIIAQSVDRILPPAEVQRPEFKPIELMPLDMPEIPKWDMVAEINRLINGINTELAKGRSLIEAVGKSASELEVNIRGYDSEIIKSKAVLLHQNRFELVDGQLRIVGHDGKPVVDSVSARERKGAVLTSSRQIDNSLPQAKNNSLAVLMNPAGWHGYTDHYGREVSPHRNAQALVFWKDQSGELKGLTFHTDLELEQAEVVMSSLGVSKEPHDGKTDQDRIVDLVRNPAISSLPAAYNNAFEYVLDKILAARGNHPFRLLQEDGTEEIVPIGELRAGIKRFDALWKDTPREEAHIATLINHILTSAAKIHTREVLQGIVYKIGEALLNLTRIHLQDSGKMPVLPPVMVAEAIVQLFNKPKDIWNNFAREIAYLKTRSGCPPSMRSTITLSGINLGSSSGGIGISSIAEWDADGPLEFECHKCHKVNDRPRNGRRPSCKWCGVKFGGC